MLVKKEKSQIKEIFEKYLKPYGFEIADLVPILGDNIMLPVMFEKEHNGRTYVIQFERLDNELLSDKYHYNIISFYEELSTYEDNILTDITLRDIQTIYVDQLDRLSYLMYLFFKMDV